MEFSDAVSNPSILDKTEEEEEEEREEEEDEEEEKSVEQECTTSVPEDTEASGLSKQADEPNGAEHKGIKNMLTNVLLSLMCIKLKRYFYKFTRGIK
jgi:CO dehydrogenase/acetyl-CoA synthase beta subunit